MRHGTRGRYTLEFKQEAVRLIESGRRWRQQRAAWEWSNRPWATGSSSPAGRLKGASGKHQVTAEQMEISRLRAELARVTMERDILGKATAYFAKGQK